MAFPDATAALDWLAAHLDYEIVPPNRQESPTLQPIRDLLAALGSPELDFPVIHVTGTNGKGTTTTLATALLGATGRRVGTFTSPDLHMVNERIAVAGHPIDDETLTELLGRLADAERATGIVLTRFELLTVGALLHFSDEGVDAAVVEVGLGGTWDSTNVVDGDVAVLTNVDLDHTAVLGNTVEEIATDKLGILKSGRVGVVGTTDERVRALAHARADRVGADVLFAGQQFELERNDVAVGGRSVTVRTPLAHYEDVLLTLHGIHQGDNATTALVAVEAYVGEPLGERLVREVFGRATMPGRLELLSRRPLIAVDGAHNPAGMRALAAALDTAFPTDGARRCILGVLAGKPIDEMVAPLLALGFVEFLCCPPRSPRAVAPHVLAEAVRRGGGRAIEFATASAALAYAREHSTDDDLIIAAGSLYLVAEVRALVLKLEHRH